MAFTPRLDTTGMAGSRYWYSNTNPFEAAGFGMPNCTCYAWGRFWEINNQLDHDETPIGITGNANTWYNSSSAYQHGMTPKLGAIICFDGGPQLTGHVGVVEQINGDGSIVTSNSDYGGTYFYTMTLNPPYSSGTLAFQGFIYNPYTDEPTPVPPRKRKRFLWFLYSRRNRDIIKPYGR